MIKYINKGEPNAMKEAYIKPNLTFEVLIPNFLAHHSHTPNDLSSKNNIIFWNNLIASKALFLHRKIDNFYENSDIEKVP